MPTRSQSQVPKKVAMFSMTHLIAIFIVASFLGGILWHEYRVLAQGRIPGAPQGTVQGGPALPPPLGNPAPPIQQKADPNAIQATQGSLMLGVDPSTASSVAETGTKLKVVGGKAVADDFCIPGSPQKCLSTAAQAGVGDTTGVGTAAPAGGGGGWTIDKDVANCANNACLGAFTINSRRAYQLFIFDSGSAPTFQRLYDCSTFRSNQLVCVRPDVGWLNYTNLSQFTGVIITGSSTGLVMSSAMGPNDATPSAWLQQHVLLRSQPIF